MSSPHRIVSVLVALALATGLGVSVATVLAVERLTEPAARSIGEPPTELGGAVAVEIPSGSGSTVHGWWIAGRPGVGAVMLMHGVRSNRLSMVERARVLSEQGYAVLLFDFQAHGESPGSRICFGGLESLDARSAARFMRARTLGEKVAAIGQSLGGAAALLGSEPLPIDALVIESVYPDIGAAIEDRMAVRLGAKAAPLVVGLLTPVWHAALKYFCGMDASELRPIDRIAAASAPLLIAAGDRDDRTRIEEARDMAARAPKTSTFWEVSGAGHVDLERFAPGSYWNRVLPFLKEHLRHDAAR